MNRLGKVLTLGLDKKRAWQLPIIAALLLLFAGGIWWYANWLGAGCFDVWELAKLDNTEDLAYVLRWRPGSVNVREGWSGRTLLHWAARMGHTEVTKILLKAGAELNAKDEDGDTPLHGAALDGHTEVARILVKAGAKVNAKDKDGLTPLYGAALDGHTEVARILLKAGAKVNAEIKGGSTPLLWAAHQGHAGFVKILLKSGAKVNAKDADGTTPLHWAARRGKTEVAKILVAAGAEVNGKNDYGETPLHWALDGHTEVVKLLVKAGGEVNAKDEDGRTPLDWAIKGSSKEVIELLRRHGAKTGKELDGEAARQKRARELDAWLDNRYDWYTREEAGTADPGRLRIKEWISAMNVEVDEAELPRKIMGQAVKCLSPWKRARGVRLRKPRMYEIISFWYRVLELKTAKGNKGKDRKFILQYALRFTGEKRFILKPEFQIEFSDYNKSDKEKYPLPGDKRILIIRQEFRTKGEWQGTLLGAVGLSIGQVLGNIETIKLLDCVTRATY